MNSKPGAGGARLPRRFDEQAVRSELERLQGELDASRKRREAANESFDRFMQTLGRSRSSADYRGSRAGTARSSPIVVRESRQLPRRGRPTGQGHRLTGLALSGLAVIGVVLVFTFAQREARESHDPAAATSPPTLTPLPATSEPGTTAAPRTGESVSAAQTEVVALRRVWVRVTADGERVLERELEAGTRVPLKAARSIVVRAGDAGAARMIIRGEDQGVLGVDGQVMTRSFELK